LQLVPDVECLLLHAKLAVNWSVFNVRVECVTLWVLAGHFQRVTVVAVLSLVIYGGVIWVLSYVLTQLPMGVVYAVWSGMGIALICITGWAVLQQPLTSVQVLCIALIIGGAIGLSLSTPAFSQAL
jgi:quaternary ammonium compound-resistance protein SugE